MAQDDTQGIEVDESEEGLEEGLDDLSAMDAADVIRARYAARATTPLRAIRAFCVHCMGDQPKAVAGCTSRSCPLYPMRMGTNPYQSGDNRKKDNAFLPQRRNR